MFLGARGALFLAAWALAPMAPAAVHAREASQPAVPGLEAGQSMWFEAPERVKAGADADGRIRIVVAIRQQQALVYRGNRLVGVSTVSTGAPGYETPLGAFTILQKAQFHRSNLYANAPMPYMQRLTWGGIALHAGELPGYPASHGCIRLPNAFARQLFDLTAMGGAVLVIDDIADTPPHLPPGPMLIADMRGLSRPATSSAAPRLAVDTTVLDGPGYELLTLRGDPPAEVAQMEPASWAAGRAADAQPGRRGAH